MEKEVFQKSNGKFDFKRNFLIKFIILAIIAVGILTAVILSPSEEETSINEIFLMFFVFIFLAVMIALVLNYFHKWIWECQNKKKIKEDQYGQSTQQKKSSFEKQVGYWALLSLVFGILSLFALPIVHVLAIIFGIIGIKKKENKAFAIAGIVLGGSILIYSIIYHLAGY